MEQVRLERLWLKAPNINIHTRNFFLLLVFTVAICFLVFEQPIRFIALPDLKPISDVEVIHSSAEASEALPSLGWDRANLPDDWYQTKRTKNQYWYRAKFDFNSTFLDDGLEADSNKMYPDLLSVYLPFVTHNASVFINDVWIGQGGRFEDPVSRHHYEPLLFTFSSKLLSEGKNTIYIRVKAELAQQGLLDQIYIGPSERLEPTYRLKKLLTTGFITWMTGFMSVISLIVFLFWILRPKDTVYAAFSLVVFLWAVHNLNLFVSEIPISPKSWEALMILTLGWVVAAMIVFNHRYSYFSNPKMEKFLLLHALSGLGLFLIPYHEILLVIGYRVWYVFLVIFGGYAIVQLSTSYVRTSNVDFLLMLYSGILILTFGVHDILLVNNHWDRRDGFIIQYGVVPASILFSWFLIKRFIRSLNVAEELACTLENRVNQKELELEKQFEKLTVMEKEKVLSDERERLMRDMHDGFGGQLVSLASQFRGQSEERFVSAHKKIHHCLTDLRFVIDSLDPLLNDLPSLLGNMRNQLEGQLTEANIELIWDVSPASKELSPQGSLHIMRIVQEVATNSAKYSNANSFTLRSGVGNGKIFIQMLDDGIGFDALSQIGECGRGLKNMAYRATQIGAVLNIESTKGGAQTKLTFEGSVEI